MGGWYVGWGLEGGSRRVGERRRSGMRLGMVMRGLKVWGMEWVSLLKVD